jgi:hypothetical protein
MLHGPVTPRPFVSNLLLNILDKGHGRDTCRCTTTLFGSWRFIKAYTSLYQFSGRECNRRSCNLRYCEFALATWTSVLGSQIRFRCRYISSVSYMLQIVLHSRTHQYVSSPIHTYSIGLAASMGSLLLAAGENGKRHCLPNASIMIHRQLFLCYSMWQSWQNTHY